MFHHFVVGCQDIPIHPLTFLPGQADTDLFSHRTPTCRILALRGCSAVAQWLDFFNGLSFLTVSHGLLPWAPCYISRGCSAIAQWL